MRRIRELAAREYSDLYQAGEHVDAAESRPARRSTREHHLDLRDLRYFAAVIEEQTIGRAAERLGLSQPTLSRQLHALERDIGVTLLERAPRGIVPTAAGESLYRDSHEILDEVSRLPAEVERGRRAAKGVCNIAATPSPNVRELLGTILRKAADRSPHLEIIVQDVPTPMQPSAVHNARFDIGLCHPFTNLLAEFPDLECWLVIHDFLDGALLPIGHPLTKKQAIRFVDLAEVPFLFFRRDFHPAFYDFMMETFRRHQYRPVIGPMQEGLATMWSLAAAGEGWCVASGAERNDPPPGVVGVRIEGFSIPWGVNILTRRGESRATPLTVTNLLLDAAAARTARRARAQ
jgi:DNA-binding transcriptional LysR family regulator